MRQPTQQSPIASMQCGKDPSQVEREKKERKMKRTYCEVVCGCSHTVTWIIGWAVVWMAAPPSPMWGQSAWPGYPNNNAISTTSGGNVGIGTSNPASPLHVVGLSPTLTNATFGTPGNGIFDILAWGGAAAGFANLSSNLHFDGANWNRWNTTNDGWVISMIAHSSPLYSSWGIYHSTSGANPASLTPFLAINASGNVGIGTTNPQYLLSVNGTIGAQDIIVTNTGWSDYVFQPGYRLRPLREIGAYIQANHHLPDIPSEAEVREKGVSVGEMQARLLAKVEELTLHMIQENERNNRLEEQNQELRDRLARLEQRAGGSATPTTAK
jgi:hypothetical protein